MKLSAFATAAWLVWLLFIVAKISIGNSPGAIKETSKRSARAFIVIAGTTLARMASSECPESVATASAFLSAVAIAAILDAGTRSALNAGTAAIVSATFISVAELMLRSPRACYQTAAPLTGLFVLLGVAIGSTPRRI